MACIDLTPGMDELLKVLRGWPDIDVDGVRDRPEWAQARAWGWVMESGELTGTGLAHAQELPPGMVVTD